ncbi:ABC transporter permease [Stackebrandtia soli]|uniref:ABC transporter permease n=1 Tax=Stackebrandtia soli TaxID=1892856 RepID=UPI0039EC4107
MSDLNERVEETIDSHQAPDYKPERAASLWGDAWRDLRKRPSVIISGLVILIVMVMGFFPELFTSVNPKSCNIALSKQGPTEGHPFGFSAEGCDYFAQTIHGAGPSIKLSLLVVAGTLVIGGLFGIIAGYYGGWIDAVFSRTVDVFNSIPFLLGAILLLTMFRDVKVPFLGAQLQAILPAVITLIIFGWTSTMRLIRASVIEARGLDYVQAARSLGASNYRIMFRHIMPNAIAPVMSLIPLSIASMISVEATLSFLGLGVRKPSITWGIMIDDAAGWFSAGYQMLLIIPSVFLVLTVLSFVLLGDAVRDALDPKLR